MTSRPDWDAIARKQRGERHGTANAYDELPPTGSWPDQQRNLKGESEAQSALNPKPLFKLPATIPRRLFLCPCCKNYVEKLPRHLRKVHKMNAPLPAQVGKTVAQGASVSNPRVVNCSEQRTTAASTPRAEKKQAELVRQYKQAKAFRERVAARELAFALRTRR